MITQTNTSIKHKLLIVLLIIIILPIASCGQKKPLSSYPRVKKAYSEKKAGIETALKQKGIALSNVELLLVALKKDRELQAWVKKQGEKKYKLLKTYAFCSTSGDLGPKRRSGDSQIPEGLYRISYFNPWSNFHLSLKVSYPNKSDRIRGKKGSLGGDIFIHGDCVTIGCIPITDDLIKELFVLGAEAQKNNSIPVLILPTKLTKESLNQLKKEYPKSTDAHQVWGELIPIYQYFVKNKNLPKVNTNSKGEYYIP